MTESAPTYKNHCYPIEIIARAIWLYYRFGVSLHDLSPVRPFLRTVQPFVLRPSRGTVTYIHRDVIDFRSWWGWHGLLLAIHQGATGGNDHHYSRPLTGE